MEAVPEAEKVESSDKPLVNGGGDSPGENSTLVAEKSEAEGQEGEMDVDVPTATSTNNEKNSRSEELAEKDGAPEANLQKKDHTSVCENQADKSGESQDVDKGDMAGTPGDSDSPDSVASEKSNSVTCVEGKEEQSVSSVKESSKKADDKHENSPTVEKSQKEASGLGDGDDVEIIGESPAKAMPPQSVIYVTGSGSGTSLLTGAPSQPNTLLLQPSNVPSSVQPPRPALLPSLPPSVYVLPNQQQYASSPAGGSSTPSLPFLNSSVPTVAPQSSMDQIELIRWEVQNRVNTRPKYFRPNPDTELGSLAKFLFDLGSDLIKETVYHDLVTIQSQKKDDDLLSEKERDDLSKLKEIEKDLHATIGHLKLKFKKRCGGCNFQTESSNVLFHHMQFPHEDNKALRCGYCGFATKQAVTFKFHMEVQHNIKARLPDKKAFYECHMCPYENNQEQKLIAHKERCLKQFRPMFNLHPSCLSGAEINLCLENIFYKQQVPKHIKLLQQKHAQQQAALAEAKRQQAQLQMIAAQKKAAAIQAKKQQREQQLLQQQQLLKQRQLANLNAQRQRAPVPQQAPVMPRGRAPQQASPGFSMKNLRPTVANMLNHRTGKNGQTIPPPVPQKQSAPPGGFEVCEICGGYVKDRKALRIHFFYAHRIDLPFNLFERNQAPLYCATCYVRFWTAQGLRKHIDTHKEENQTKGVVGKCISCGHHVLNLLLHMRVVHNRELQHYINALMCMFCGGHFSSRNDCERHIIKAHGNIDPVSGAVKLHPQSGAKPNMTSPANNKSGKKTGKGGKSLVKGSVCVLCNLNFGRNVDLTRHCMRMHHTCMKCGMVVIDKASLMKHTCLTSPSGTRDCGMCGEEGFHPAYYVKHLRDKHLRKFSIKVARVSKNVIECWTKRPCPFDDDKKKDAILVEISDSDDEKSDSVEELASFVPPKRPALGPASWRNKVKQNGAKKPRIGPASKIGREAHTVTDIESNGVEEEAARDEHVSMNGSVSGKLASNEKKESAENSVGNDSEARITRKRSSSQSSETEEKKRKHVEVDN